MVVASEKMPKLIKENDKRLVIYLPQKLYEQVVVLATKEDRSVSNFSRNLIANGVKSLLDKGDTQ